MSNENTEQVVTQTLRAVFLIISDPEHQQRLQSEDEYEIVLDKLDLPKSSRPALLEIINRIEQLIASTHNDTIRNGSIKTRQDIENILLESFVHIRWSFWVSLIMSVALFIIGMCFLIVAVFKSISESSVTTATLTIAGIGIADFILLFYTKPWQDISKNLSNSQQIKIVATSYLSGLSLVSQKRENDLKMLDKLTKNSVELIQVYTEESSQIEGNNEQ